MNIQSQLQTGVSWHPPRPSFFLGVAYCILQPCLAISHLYIVESLLRKYALLLYFSSRYIDHIFSGPEIFGRVFGI